MPQKWEQGNAAMQPAYDESAVQNPFTPIDYAARLQSSPRKPRQEQRYMPPVPSAPPMPAPGYEPPQYMQIPAQGYPAQNAAGAPYSAALFEHQPTAVMPSGWEQTPFADRTAIEFWKEQPVQQPVWQQPEPEAEPEPEPGPVYYSAADIPLRDPFTPAKPREDAEKQPEEARQPKQEKKRSGRSRIRVGRLLALIAACVMLLVCALAGGQMLAELVRSERENKEHEANGTQLYAGAIEVELPPAGETFAPEFLNRIDDIITFTELGISNMEPIVELQLEDVRRRLADRHITLDVTPAAMEHLAIDGYDPVYGARPLKRLIQRQVVDRIAEVAVQGKLRDRSHVLVDLDDEGNYVCRVEEPLSFDFDELLM